MAARPERPKRVPSPARVARSRPLLSVVRQAPPMARRFALLDASHPDDHADENFPRVFDADVERFAVREGDLPTDHARFDAAVLSGSQASVLDDRDWIDREARWVNAAVAHGLPVLGVCFGHQLLAAVLGGTVEHMGRFEVGYHEVHHDGSTLFSDLPEWLTVFTVHEDAVTRLPLGSRLTAENNFCVQAFARPPAFGVQFHAEFDVASAGHVMRERGLPAEQVERVVEQVTETRHAEVEPATGLFRNFEQFVDARAG